MSLSQARAGHVTNPIFSPMGAKNLGGVQFYEAALAAVKDQPGLIHGKIETKDGFCVLGAVCNSVGDVIVPTHEAEEMQEANDSVPEKTPVERRDFMIGWLKGKLAQLEDKP